MTNPEDALEWLERKEERTEVGKNEYTNCLECSDIKYNEERGHITTFNYKFALALIANRLDDENDDIHMVIDVSRRSDYWEKQCYHITWKRNFSKED